MRTINANKYAEIPVGDEQEAGTESLPDLNADGWSAETGEAEEPDRDESDKVCTCGDPDCNRIMGHSEEP